MTAIIARTTDGQPTYQVKPDMSTADYQRLVRDTKRDARLGTVLVSSASTVAEAQARVTEWQRLDALVWDRPVPRTLLQALQVRGAL